MAIVIPSLGIVVAYAYDEETSIGVWQVEPMQGEDGPCKHALVLYSDGDVALAHTQIDGTRFEYLKDEANPIEYVDEIAPETKQ